MDAPSFLWKLDNFWEGTWIKTPFSKQKSVFFVFATDGSKWSHTKFPSLHHQRLEMAHIWKEDWLVTGELMSQNNFET